MLRLKQSISEYSDNAEFSEKKLLFLTNQLVPVSFFLLSENYGFLESSEKTHLTSYFTSSCGSDML